MESELKVKEYKVRIIQAAAQIPSGKVATYGQVAKYAGLPGYARYVGTVLRNLPKGSNIPWHRVINAQGKISFPAEDPRHKEQMQRLQDEGVVFEQQKINLNLQQWQA